MKLSANRGAVLKGFRGDTAASAFAFLKTVTQNLGRDALRRMQTEGRDARATIPIDSVGYLMASKENTNMDRRILVAEIDEFLRSEGSQNTADRDRRIFWMYYGEGLTVASIAGNIADIGLTTKGVESVVYRLTRQIRERFMEKAKGFSTASASS